MHHTKKSIIAAVLLGAAIGSHAEQVQRPQSFFMPPPVVLRAEPVPAKAFDYVTTVTSSDGLMRLALDARLEHEAAAKHGYAFTIAAVCDPHCQAVLKGLPSVAMAAQSFGAQFIQGDAATLQRLVAQGWFKLPAY
uniref:Uncharacterized protein n=1 Tax=mine drainage metagenome TaxID=410659 RepID=E6PQ09_9ZZZZ